MGKCLRLPRTICVAFAMAFAFTNSNTNASAVYREFWGSGLTAATQDVRWQYVDLETIPEPASLGLLAVGAVGIGVRRRVGRA